MGICECIRQAIDSPSIRSHFPSEMASAGGLCRYGASSALQSQCLPRNIPELLSNGLSLEPRRPSRRVLYQLGGSLACGWCYKFDRGCYDNFTPYSYPVGLEDGC